MRSLLVLTLLLTLFSCADVKRSKYLEEIVGLTSDVDAMISNIEEVDTVFFQELFESSHEIDAYLNQIENDTISYDLALRLDTYSRLGDQVKQNIESIKEVEKLLEAEIEALNKLKSDIETDNGRRDRYAEYVNFEKEKVVGLKGEMEQKISELDEAKDIYTSMKEFVNTELKRRIYTEEVYDER